MRYGTDLLKTIRMVESASTLGGCIVVVLLILFLVLAFPAVLPVMTLGFGLVALPLEFYEKRSKAAVGEQ